MTGNDTTNARRPNRGSVAEGGEEAMSEWARWWPQVLIVLGVMMLSYGCSGLSGVGGRDGGTNFGYSVSERRQIAIGSAFATIGGLALIRRRGL